RAQSITSMINKITDIQKNNKELWNNENFADNVGDIIYNSDTPAKVKLAEKLLTDKEFPKEIISKVLIAIDKKGTNLNYALELCQNYKQIELTPNKIPIMIQNAGKISPKQIQKLNHIMGRDKVSKLSDSDFILACNFADIYKKNNINEIPASGKKALLRSLVASKDGLFNISDELSKDFPLIPKNQEEYCSLLPSIVRSLGIETSPLTPEQRIAMFNSSMKDLSLSVAKLSDVDFANLQITQDIPKDEFTKIVLEKVKDLSSAEKQKVYDYFGFELHHNKDNTQTGYSITGYPVNLNNGKKLAQITDSKTKAVIEDLRPEVIRFSKENPIRCNNPEVEAMLNQIVDALPELRTTIGRAQHGNNGTKGAHDFDVMKHSLKVMQKITQDSQFAKLNESDQKIMLLASLMHDITKAEGKPDKTHANESSFDSFFIAKKFNLTKEEEIKLYTLIRHHEWLEYVNTAKSEEQLTKRLQSVAYDLRQDNLFDMALMFTHADLRAVKADDSFHDRVDGKSRVDFKGSLRSFGQSADLYAKRIRECIKELQKSQPILPVTKFPKADRISQAITHVNPDGSTNIKGVYKDKDGLVIIRFNEVEDWEAIGFAEGSVSKGYTSADDERETGNIKFFIHGLEYANQLSKFDAFSLVDSDALLSVSYAEAVETKYRFFRSQGVILDVDTKYIHGGGETDSGSGYGKNINEFKNNYAYKGSERHSDRIFIADMVKRATGMSDKEYIEFVKANANKPMSEIEPAEIRDKIIKEFATINSRTRRGDRSYNEMYISNPSEVMGVFAYSQNDNIGPSATEFVERNNERLGFLKQYALERNIPLVIFGD
ncbi:MAG: HD domain-containing protein, partial [bacterium]|nr:HD domain-containing protein [bacterium]